MRPLFSEWPGPVGPGRFPDDSETLGAMQAPGVYLRAKAYDGDRVVGYVGQSQNVLSRIDQHLAGLLSLQQTLRDAMGRIVSRGDFAEYAVLVEAMPGLLRCAYIEQRDLFAGRWAPVVRQVLDQPPPTARPGPSAPLEGAPHRTPR